MSVSRISKLKGFDNIIAGRDLSNVFKDGHVYSFTEIMGVIIVKDLGEYAEGDERNKGDFPSLMMEGTYLLTEEEYSKEKSITK